jgi:hypothetical protein
MIRLTVTLSLLSFLASCREGRDASSPIPGDEQDDASVTVEPHDGAQVTEAGPGAALDGEAVRDARGELQDTSVPAHDASTARADTGSAPTDSAAPADAASTDAGGKADASAGADAGPALSNCVLLTSNNTQGVGDGCTQAARELACPTTRTCLEGLVEQGLHAPEPYFCTKDCSQSTECGENARCCKPRGWPGKICVLDSCRANCE